MSLPVAPKQTAEKPTPGSVMEPTNKDDQAADIDRKVSTRGSSSRLPGLNLSMSRFDFTALFKPFVMGGYPTTLRSTIR